MDWGSLLILHESSCKIKLLYFIPNEKIFGNFYSILGVLRFSLKVEIDIELERKKHRPSLLFAIITKKKSVLLGSREN